MQRIWSVVMLATSLGWFLSIAYVLYGLALIFLTFTFWHFLCAGLLFVFFTCAVIACAALHG